MNEDRMWGMSLSSGQKKWGGFFFLGAMLLLLGGLFVPVGGGLELHAAKRYAGGAPPGYTGGFEEMTCDGCHFDYLPNAESGRLELSGVPEQFTPGESYLLTLKLARSGMKAGGFQLTARFAEAGGQAGEFVPSEEDIERLAIVESAGVEYLHQTDPGSRLVLPDTAQWSFHWTAPSEGGTVLFHAAGNAADGDGSTSGDYIHTTTAESQGP